MTMEQLGRVIFTRFLCPPFSLVTLVQRQLARHRTSRALVDLVVQLDLRDEDEQSCAFSLSHPPSLIY